MKKPLAIDISEKFNRAVALHQKRQLIEARAAYSEVLQLAPNHTGAIANLGSVLRALGKTDECIALLVDGHRRLPSATDISFNLGNAYYTQGNLAEALAAFQNVVHHDPGNALAWYSIGTCHQDQRSHAQAEQAYGKALAADPKHYDTYLNLSGALADQGRSKEAIELLKRATTLEPGKGPAWNNLGMALQETGQFEAAVEAYKRAFALEPSHRIASNILMGLQYNHTISDAALVATARSYGKRFPEPKLPAATNNPQNALRIGFVSADLYAHPVGFFLRAVVRELVAKKIDCTFYSNGQRVDDLTLQLKAGSRWRHIVSQTDEQVARQIRDDGITVLIDLSGHSAKNRLPVFAQRPAPLQISWLGYFATTGLQQMDAILMDPWHAPPGSEQNFTETVVRLPDSRFCYSPPEFAPAVSPPPSIAKGYITFGSFNNTSKINSRVIALWARVLLSVPNSRLLLKWRSLEEQGFAAELVQQFGQHGIDANRIELRGQSVHVELLRQYADMDIALDPFPFNGGQTSCEALWMGVPVITLPGGRPVSRQTLCFLANINKLEWAARNEDEYLRAAQELASNPDKLRTIRLSMRQEMTHSTLCDAKKFTNNFLEAINKLLTEPRSRSLP